jgi:nitrile hydratase subunit beta
MNGAHDMGGRMGFGPVRPEPNEPVFHAKWEARLFALSVLYGNHGSWTLDEDRHVCENQPPRVYLSKSYYEIWLHALETLMAAKGLALLSHALTSVQVLPAMMERGSYVRDITDVPKFQAGGIVRVRNLHSAGHTRIPGYLRGHTGEIVSHQGAHVFPDSNAHGKGENPQHLYCVRFKSADVFATNSPDTIHADMWEPYIEAV